MPNSGSPPFNIVRGVFCGGPAIGLLRVYLIRIPREKEENRMKKKVNRKATPWKTDNWFVSPWNYQEEVTQGFKPPKKVRIHDVTLRDGEQQAGIIYRKQDKVRIAEKLAEAGVHRIETGMPAVSPMDEAAIREIVKRNLGPEIFCFSRCIVDDLKRAADW